MTLNHLFGAALVVSPFVALYIGAGKHLGWKAATAIFVFVFGVAAMFLTGTYLLTS